MPGRFDPALLDRLGSPVTSLVLDSRRVQPGDTFVACPGLARDGRAYIAQAIGRGAVSVIWQDGDAFAWDPAWRVPNLPIEGLRERLGELASHVYGHPSRALSVIAVTGTNGKTSVTRWIAQALTASGRKCALIGTLGAGYADGEPMAGLANTTPDAVTLHAALAGFVRDGAQAVALEASSIALEQRRLDAVAIDVAVFTNLTRDHLDYHGSMQAYGEAKALLFAWPTLSHAVINLDDAFGRELAERARARGLPVLGFALDPLHAGQAAIAGHDLHLDQRGMRLEIDASGLQVAVSAPLLGAFNASNLLATAGALVASGVPTQQLASVLAVASAPPGRMEPVAAAIEAGTALPSARALPLVVVDYAHTPDALANALSTLRPMLASGGRLTCVFGCGGDRDPGKRPLMGTIASRGADAVWVTSDNPRGEPAQQIIDQVLAGMQGAANVRTEVDRRQAIEGALAQSAAADIVLIAGKGHERWQEIGGVRHPFDDRLVAAQALRALAAVER
jgi:UDP-N-acetylmuramoyl-L-alanyl-D-glutamate--2,6-diaminopimelate ligase